MAGWLAPPAEAVHVPFGSVLGDDRKMLRSRSRRRGQADRAARRGGRARRGRGRREEPRPRRRHARRGRAHDRHRRGQVRRPVDRPRQGLRLRLGPDARVRRQHGAVPAVRARPHLLDLPSRRRRSRRRARASPITIVEPQERQLAQRLLGYPTAHRATRWRPTRRTSCAPTCSTSPRTSPRSTSTAR